MLSTLTSTSASVSASYRVWSATGPHVRGLRRSVRAVQLTYAIVFLIGVTIVAVVATTLMNATVGEELLAAVATSEWTIPQSVVLVSAVRRNSAAVRARGLQEARTFTPGLSALIGGLCEPQLSRSRRRKSYGGSAIGTSLDLCPVRLWKTVGLTKAWREARLPLEKP